MTNHWPLLLSVVTFASLISLNSTSSAYAQNGEIKIEGTITPSGCRVEGWAAGLSGNVIKYQVSETLSQSMDLCQFGERYFRIVSSPVCAAAIGVGTDPKTGKKYTFPTLCDIPRECNSPNSWGTTHGYFESSLNLQHEAKKYIVRSGSENAICNFESVVPSESKVSLLSQSIPNTNASLTITIPKAVLDGNFSVLTDGKPAPFKVTRSANDSELVTEVKYSETGKAEIEILGTQVIPEFPANVILLVSFVAATFVILLLQKGGNNSSRIIFGRRLSGS